MRDALLLFQCPTWQETLRQRFPGAIELTYEQGLYPNDEQWIHLNEEGPFERVRVFARFGDHHDLDRQVMRLHLLLEVLNRQTLRIELVVPYVPYSLQDRDVRGGDAAALRVLLATWQSLGVKKLTVADIHSPQSVRSWTEPVEHWETERLLADALQKYLPESPTIAVIAPDKGALSKAERLGEYLRAPVFTFEKERRGAGDVSVQLKNGLTPQSATDLIIVDDMINTGGTLVAIIHALRLHTNARIWTVVSHGLFAGSALKKLQESGVERVVCLDSFDSAALRDRSTLLEVVSCNRLFSAPEYLLS